ncbi:MAG: pyridine nucleotide-disulfide oxidoreductase dimerization region [uncultured bacterium]|nr:MAG: pyridine nucleotide-disulfide oxidoreductase dimerization region [uncultured bacterium]
MQEHLIIIGGVAAGPKAAAKARRENPDLKITLYTDGYHISYSSCSLPYYIEGLIQNPEKLLVRSPETFKTKYNVNVHIRHRVVKISPDTKTVEIENLENADKFQDKYTKLLIATGAHPFIPDIEGIHLNNVFTLRTFLDALKIKEKMNKHKKAVIVGAGYIGLEMVEALQCSGLDVTLIELACQILPILDTDMAEQIEKYLTEEKNLKIITCNRLERLIGDEEGNVKQIETDHGQVIDTDIVLLSPGVRPNVELAKNAGIEIGEAGAIKVNDRMQTSIPDIYAVGDCAEQIHLITGKPVWIPLGSTANKQGRVAAINITGGDAKFKGVLGSHVSKIFDYTNAGSGLSEREAQKHGYDYQAKTITYRDKSGHYPGAKDITIKLIADKKTRKLLGAQIIGKGDADKRANIIATALTAGLTIDDIPDIDITYSPPYSPVIDPIIVAAEALIDKI